MTPTEALRYAISTSVLLCDSWARRKYNRPGAMIEACPSDVRQALQKLTSESLRTRRDEVALCFSKEEEDKRMVRDLKLEFDRKCLFSK